MPKQFLWGGSQTAQAVFWGGFLLLKMPKQFLWGGSQTAQAVFWGGFLPLILVILGPIIIPCIFIAAEWNSVGEEKYHM
jgi:hypothetical protein